MLRTTILLGVAWAFFAVSTPAAAVDEAIRGQALFRTCAVCHSLTPGEHLTGPSLHGVVGRRAASAPGFTRYSPALRRADLTWNAATLDRWLVDPQALVPGTTMVFRGIDDPQARRALIAYLAQGAENGPPGRGGMMRRLPAARPMLKEMSASRVVSAIHYCGDSYRVRTADGAERSFWEYNLRFKTDSGKDGPRPGAPVILPAGMMGDRAAIIFATPAEISAAIRSKCLE